MRGQYVLNDQGEPVEEPDLLKWGTWMQTADRQVALDEVGGVQVSTVFLGLDMRFGPGAPHLFETLCRPGDIEGRYSTREEALRGHAQTITSLLREQQAEPIDDE